MYKIATMKKEEIPQVLELWHNQYKKYFSRDFSPDFWEGGKKEIESFLLQGIKHDTAIVAKENKEIAGYMAYMVVDFHSEKSAFCPIVGHAAIEEDKEQIYRAMYNYVSRKWIENNAFNHLWMIFCDDDKLKTMLYDIGFGSYVIDTCQKTSDVSLKINSPYRISTATLEDVNILYSLMEESRIYYVSPPIFLKRDVYTKEMITSFIKDNVVFIAWDGNTPIGFFGLTRSERYNIETLAVPDSGQIKGLGAFIIEEYRGRGIGKWLFKEVFDYCKDAKITYLHVNYETANPNASRFWPKYLKPVILSVRRTVNKDANA